MRKRFSFALLAFLIGASLLSSCSSSDSSSTAVDNNTTVNNVSIPSKVISGKLKHRTHDYISQTYLMKNWDLGATKISYGYSVSDIIGTANVSADGSFSLTLPDKIKSSKLFSPTINYQITPSPSDLQGTIVPLYISVAYTQDGVSLNGEVHITTFTDGAYSRVASTYAIYCFDNSGTINGTASSNDVYNLSVSKGWNYIYSVDDNAKTGLYKSSTTLSNDVVIYKN